MLILVGILTVDLCLYSVMYVCIYIRRWLGLYIYIYVYVYLYMCVCVCVCVYGVFGCTVHSLCICANVLLNQ